MLIFAPDHILFAMEFIDTHCHIYDEAFDADRVDTITRAKDAGICRFILPAISSATHEAMMQSAEILGECGFPCIGLHPTEVVENWEAEMDFVRTHLHDAAFKAIGEIGIDEHWSVEFLEQQKRVFAEQIEIAARENLPVIIHSRDATEDIFKVLEDTRGIPVRGVFHAYSGSYETYCRCLKYGDFKFGIGGVVTYKKAGIAGILPKMSLSDIVLETDCPYLTPVPHRGERNESAYIEIIAGKIAELTGCGIEKIAALTTGTARKLFNII